MSDVRLSDPCPCGSGKKYKRCCKPGRRPPDPTSPPEGSRLLLPWEVDAVLETRLDLRVVSELNAWISTQDPEAATRALDAYGIPPDDEPLWQALDFLSHLTAYMSPWPSDGEGGTRWCERFPGELFEEERRWHEFERAGWFSLWQVGRPPFQGHVELRDLLTGYVRQVRCWGDLELAQEGDTFLACVLGYEGYSLGWCVARHPRVVPAAEAARQIEALRASGGVGERPLPPSRLQGELALALLERWRDLGPTQHRLLRREGAALPSTRAWVDNFTFAPAARDQVAAALEGAFESGGEDERGWTTYFVPGSGDDVDDSEEADVEAEIHLMEDRVELVHGIHEDAPRADAVVAEVVAVLGSLVARGPREEHGMFQPLARVMLAGGEFTDPLGDTSDPDVEDPTAEADDGTDDDGTDDDDATGGDEDDDADGDPSDLMQALSTSEGAALALAYKQKHYAA